MCSGHGACTSRGALSPLPRSCRASSLGRPSVEARSYTPTVEEWLKRNPRTVSYGLGGLLFGAWMVTRDSAALIAAVLFALIGLLGEYLTGTRPRAGAFAIAHEPPFEVQDTTFIARRGRQIAIGSIAALAVVTVLASAIRPPVSALEENGASAQGTPTSLPQPSATAPSESSPTADSESPGASLVRPGSPPASDQPSPGVRATVISVVDGDTIHALVGGIDERIRIIGLDSPESRQPGTPVECLANEATEAAKALLAPGDEIVLQEDPTQDLRDRFDRLLAHVILANDDLFAERMIEQGWAVHFIYRGTASIYADRLAAAQERAMATGAGLWGATTCDGDPHAASATP